MARYGHGVRANGERTSNRRWGDYPAEVAALSQKLEREAVNAIDRELQ
jgi:hypothetical protein